MKIKTTYKKIDVSSSNFLVFDFSRKPENLFLNHYLKFWSFDPRGDVIYAKMDVKGLNCHFMYQCSWKGEDQKWKVLWGELFVYKTFSHNFEVLTQRGDVIWQNWLKKGLKLVSHVLMVVERWKSKVSRTLRWDIRLWN